MKTIEFIETATFTKMVTALLTDEEYRGLQNELVEDPELGALIKGGGASESCATPSKGVEKVAA